jgi:hypothetical protein
MGFAVITIIDKTNNKREIIFVLVRINYCLPSAKYAGEQTASALYFCG